MPSMGLDVSRKFLNRISVNHRKNCVPVDDETIAIPFRSLIRTPLRRRRWNVSARLVCPCKIHLLCRVRRDCYERLRGCTKKIVKHAFLEVLGEFSALGDQKFVIQNEILCVWKQTGSPGVFTGPNMRHLYTKIWTRRFFV